MIITTLSDTTGKYAEGEENRSSPQGRAEKAAADSENADGDRRKQELQKAQLPGNTGWLCLVFSVRFHPPTIDCIKTEITIKGVRFCVYL